MTTTLAETDIGFKNLNNISFTSNGSRILSFSDSTISSGMYEVVLSSPNGTKYWIGYIQYKAPSASLVIINPITGGVTTVTNGTSSVTFSNLTLAITYYITVRYMGLT